MISIFVRSRANRKHQRRCCRKRRGEKDNHHDYHDEQEDVRPKTDSTETSWFHSRIQDGEDDDTTTAIHNIKKEEEENDDGDVSEAQHDVTARNYYRSTCSSYAESTILHKAEEEVAGEEVSSSDGPKKTQDNDSFATTFSPAPSIRTTWSSPSSGLRRKLRYSSTLKTMEFSSSSSSLLDVDDDNNTFAMTNSTRSSSRNSSSSRRVRRQLPPFEKSQQQQNNSRRHQHQRYKKDRHDGHHDNDIDCQKGLLILEGFQDHTRTTTKQIRGDHLGVIFGFVAKSNDDDDSNDQ